MSLPDGQRTIGPHFVADADLAGLLFDCDGTLIDTMPLFYHSWAEVCPQHGLSMSEGDFYGFAGKPLPDIVREMHRAQKGTDATDAFVAAFLAEKKRAHLQAEEKLGAPAPIACVVALARGALARGVPVCLATSGSRETHVERRQEARRLLIERRLPTGCGSTSSGTSRAQGSRTSSTRGWGTWCARRRWRQARDYTRWHEMARSDTRWRRARLG